MIWSPSIMAFTAGHSCRAKQQALVKKLMKPRFTPCASLNLSLYLARNSMMALISTSLKVVSMAVVFFASTKRRLTVLRRLLIFSGRSLRVKGSVPGLLPGLLMASSTSCLTILPLEPVGTTFLRSGFLSAIIAAATGVAFTDVATGVGAAFSAGLADATR